MWYTTSENRILVDSSSTTTMIMMVRFLTLMRAKNFSMILRTSTSYR